MLSLQKLKFSFVTLLWSETNLFLEDGPTTLVHFIYWVGVKRGFFLSCSFLVDFFVRG